MLHLPVGIPAGIDRGCGGYKLNPPHITKDERGHAEMSTVSSSQDGYIVSDTVPAVAHLMCISDTGRNL